MLQSGVATNSLLGSGILETSPYTLMPMESYQTRLWHPLHLQADGEFVQLRFYMNDEQMLSPLISESDFQLHAMTFYVTPTASRLQ